MPYRDGTGPQGAGPATGGGMGPCGRGLRQGRGNWFSKGLGGFSRPRIVKDEKTALDEEEKMLKEELNQVQKAKEDLKN